MTVLRSTRVRAKDFQTPWLAARAAECALQVQLHRKVWEVCVIAQAYHERIRQGGALLGFGVGKEPLPAWFAAHGATVVASDAPVPDPAWADTGQYARGLEDLERPAICAPVRFRKQVSFQAIDMAALPALPPRTPRYDFTWSCGSFEHLGSLEAGLAFFLQQMAYLRPGGLAVHTTEFNPDEDGPTLEARDLALYRRREIDDLAARLAAQGDHLYPFDDTPGTDPADRRLDTEPWGLPHLSIQIGGFVTTSIVLMAERGSRAREGRDG